MKVKKISIIILLFTLIFSLVACSSDSSSGDSSDGDKVTLTLWYWNRSIDDDLIKRANEQFPNIEIKPQKIDGGEYKTKLQTTIAAGSGGPDIVALNDWVTEFLPHHEEFVNLLDYGADEIQGDYLDWKWNYALTADEKALIALPMDTGPTGLFYREDFFAEAGLPSDPAEVTEQIKTWEDLMEAGVKVEAATGAKITDSVNRVFTQYISQQDSAYFDTEDNFIGDQGSIKEAWDLAMTFHERGLSANLVDETERNAGLNNGQVAAFVGAVWEADILEDAAPDTSGKWRVTRAPGGDGNNGGSFIGILKTSKHPEEAYEVIKWMMNPENQLQSYKTMELFPSTPSIFGEEMNVEAEFFGGQNITEVFSASAENVKPRYFGPSYSTVNTLFTDQITNVVSQGLDPNQAWQDVLDSVEKELSR